MTHLRLNTRLLRGAGIVMLALLFALIFAEHSHHFCSAMGHPDSACPNGAAQSHSFHWPEAGDQFAARVADYTPQVPTLHVFYGFSDVVEALESTPREAPQHVPIYA